MIIRAVTVCIILSLAYCLVQPSLPQARRGLQGGSQWEKNRIREESLVCSNQDYKVVVVGSSVSARLAYLPDDWFNLSLASYSSIQGLEIICNSEIQPCKILIETNNLNIGTSEYKPLGTIERQAKQRVAAFRTINKPVHSLLRILGNAAGIEGGSAKPPEYVADVPDKRTVSDKIYQQALDRRLKNDAVPMHENILENRLNRIKKSVNTLKSRGFEFIFMRVPETEETAKTARAKQLASAYRNAFPTSEFGWFDDENNVNLYASNDALHLTPQSALRFSRQLELYVDNQVMDRIENE